MKRFTSISRYKWHIPLNYNDGNGTIWLHQTPSMTFTNPRADNSADNSLFKFNSRQTGYYRVQYTDDQWKHFATKLKDNVDFIPEAIDRSNLLDDAVNLARSQKIKYDLALSMTEYMQAETMYFPWRTAYSAFTYINSMLYGEINYHLWRKYVMELSEAMMERLPVKAEGGDLEHLDSMLQSYIISLACSNGNAACLRNTSTIFNDWIDDESYYVHPNIRQDIYTYGMREEGGEREWNIMWKRYEASESAQEKLYLLRGLAQAPQLYLLQRYLDFCMEEDKVRRQDFFSAVNYAASNPHGELYVWNWAQTVYPQLIERFTTSDRYFGRMIPDLVSDFKTEYRLDEVNEFFEKYPEAGAGANSRKQAIETIENNIEWRDANMEDVFSFLREKYVDEWLS